MTGRTGPWFGFAEPHRYPGCEPHFYEPDTLPGVRTLEAGWREIRDEVSAVLAAADAPRTAPYFDPRLVLRPGSWKTLALYTQRLRYRRNCERLPRTDALLRSVPNLVSASLSWLEPQSEIKPHFGDSDAFVRIHLGLVIPGQAPACALEVGGETRGWTEGKLTLFCDAHTHRAWNRTDSARLILIADVMRPELAARGRWYSAQVLSALALYKIGAQAARRLPSGLIRKSPGFGPAPLRRAAQLAAAVPFVLYSPLQARIAVLPPYS